MTRTGFKNWACLQSHFSQTSYRKGYQVIQIYEKFLLLMMHKLCVKVHFHGDNYASFHKFCRPEVLPTTLGGRQTWEEVQDDELFQRLYSKEAYFKKLAEFSKN